MCAICYLSYPPPPRHKKLHRTEQHLLVIVILAKREIKVVVPCLHVKTLLNLQSQVRFPTVEPWYLLVACTTVNRTPKKIIFFVWKYDVHRQLYNDNKAHSSSNIHSTECTPL